MLYRKVFITVRSTQTTTLTFRNINFDELPFHRDAAIQGNGLFQVFGTLKLHITKPLESVRLLILNKSHIFNNHFLKNLIYVSLHDADWQISDEGREGWLRREGFFAASPAAAPVISEIVVNVRKIACAPSRPVNSKILNKTLGERPPVAVLGDGALGGTSS